jgi:hypothetical protein
MMKRVGNQSAKTGPSLSWTGLLLAALALCATQAGHAQGSTSFPALQSHPQRQRPMPDRLPDKPTIPPTFSIPVEPLGFSAPSIEYLGQRWRFASLDFLDENRLLFTFRVPGLIHREPGDKSSDERQIRAVVLTLPTGSVSAEALWTVHDRVRYLWMLKDGHYLLRDRDGIEEGDATLNLKPYLHFPGPVLWMEMDPLQQYLVTNSREPATDKKKPDDLDEAPTAQATMTVDGQKPGVPDMVVRILRRDSGKVMLLSRTRTAVHLPINADGYLEGLRGNGEQWLLNLNYFNGGSVILGHVDSACAPNFDFVSQRELLVTACDDRSESKLLALDTDGHRLWENLSSSQAVWPLLVMGLDGTRLARETLAVNHEVSAFSPLDSEDIRGQLVRVFDAASGKVLLEAAANPALDAGGNVAISPSGRHVAVINAGAIEVFELPPQVPEAGSTKDSSSH